MLANMACNVLNTLQVLAHIKELWPSVIRITYILSTLHLPECIQTKQSLDPPPQTPSIHPTYLSHPQILCLSILIVQGPKSSINFRLPVLIPCCPFRHRVPSARSRMLSCPSPAQSQIFPFSLVSFHIGSSHSTLTLPLPRIPSTLHSHKSLGFLLLSILIRCPNHLSSLLLTI